MKIKTILIIAIILTLLTACTETPPASGTPEITPGIEEFTAEPEPEPEEPTEPDEPIEPAEVVVEPIEPEEVIPVPLVKFGVESVEEFIFADSGWFLRGILPYFEDINDLHMTTILSFGVFGLEMDYVDLTDNAEFLERIFGDKWISLGNTRGFEIEDTEWQLQLALSPDFSFDNYDYKSFTDNEPELGFKVIWDEQTEMLILFCAVFGGGDVHHNRIIETYEEDDIIYVIAENFWCTHEYCEVCNFDYIHENEPELLEYSLYMFKENNQGYINIISKQAYNP
ncbi:MAG: hypothetical protein FWH20_09885 [Oscillospiraceae bacterium]|nr:hypothetical protein [Oscillospiraceae bacterium]